MCKSSDQFVAGINRALDLQRVQHTVAFDDHIDFVAVPVIPQQTFLGIIVVGLQQFGNNLVL